MDIDEESAFNDVATGTVVVEAGPSSQPLSGGGGGDAPRGMSKNAQKKAAKQAKLEALKPLKRAAEKERRRARAAQLSAGYAAGTLSAEDKAIFEKRKQVEKDRKAAKRRIESGQIGEGWEGGVVVDLGFDGLMNDQEIASMAQQLGYLYSVNRTASRPFATILHTSFSPSASPRLWDRMTKSTWERWSRSYWWAEGVDALNSHLPLGTLSSQSQLEAEEKSALPITQAKEGLESHLTGPTLPPAISDGRHKLIYLSADAEDELDVLAEDEVYIIGGIVDRNRYKNLCQDKAEKLGIRTARLPIGKYLENLPTRKVLTVNQVFDILVKWVELRDWAKAFEAVIPQRKYHSGRKDMRAAKVTTDEGRGVDDTSAPGEQEDEQGEQEEQDQEGGDGGAERGEVDEEAAMNA